MIQAAFESGHTGRTDLGAALAFARRVMKRRGVVVILSDFVSPRFEQELASLARKHTTHAILVHDPLEHQLPGLGALSVVDAESGEARTLWAGGGGLMGPVDGRLAELRRVGVRASALSTNEDAFLRLQRHFMSQGRR